MLLVKNTNSGKKKPATEVMKELINLLAANK